MPPKRSRATAASAADVDEPSRKKSKDQAAPPSPLTKDAVSTLTHSEVRDALAAYGENPGPINDGTRPLYEKMLLKRLQEGSSAKATAAKEVQKAAASPPPKTKQSPFGRQTGASTSFLSSTMQESPPAKASTLSSSWKSSTAPAQTFRPSASPSAAKAWPTTVASSPSRRTTGLGTQVQLPAITAQGTRGLVAATYTPLNASGGIHVSVIDSYAKHLISNNVSGVFVNGTTGEGVKFSVDERKDLVEKWMAAAQGRLAVFVHVGAESVKDAQEMAIHASEVGAHAIAVIAPTMFQAKSADHMVDFCAAVALAAPDLPLYYYHIPALTKSTFSIEDFLDSAVQRIASFAGVKYSDADLALFGACRYHSNGDLHLMYGKDEQLLAALAMGADTFVGSTYNLYPKLYHEIASAYENGQLEEARRLQLLSWSFIKVLLHYGGVIPAGRCLLEHLGVKVGPPRVPDRAPDAASIRGMIQDLQNLNFFKWA